MNGTDPKISSLLVYWKYKQVSLTTDGEGSSWEKLFKCQKIFSSLAIVTLVLQTCLIDLALVTQGEFECLRLLGKRIFHSE